MLSIMLRCHASTQYDGRFFRVAYFGLLFLDMGEAGNSRWGSSLVTSPLLTFISLLSFIIIMFVSSATFTDYFDIISLDVNLC